MPSWTRGAEVWTIYFDRRALRFCGRVSGHVARVERRGVIVRKLDGTLELMGYPAFPTEAEAQQWCDEHPYRVPRMVDEEKPPTPEGEGG